MTDHAPEQQSYEDSFILPTPAVEAYTGMSRHTIITAAKLGQIPGQLANEGGKQWRFRPADLPLIKSKLESTGAIKRAGAAREGAATRVKLVTMQAQIDGLLGAVQRLTRRIEQLENPIVGGVISAQPAERFGGYR